MRADNVIKANNFMEAIRTRIASQRKGRPASAQGYTGRRRRHSEGEINGTNRTAETEEGFGRIRRGLGLPRRLQVSTRPQALFSGGANYIFFVVSSFFGAFIPFF